MRQILETGAEHSGFPAAVGSAFPEQVSAAPTAVSWAALTPGPGSEVCVGRLEVASLAGGTESHLLPYKHGEALSSALGRGLCMGTGTFGLSPSEACETRPIVQGLEGTFLLPGSGFSTAKLN